MMNVALYDPTRGHQLLGHQFYQDCTPDEVREMVFLIQMEALENGTELGSSFLVAWQDLPSQYLSVFTLGDDAFPDEELLNAIEALARTRH